MPTLPLAGKEYFEYVINNRERFQLINSVAEFDTEYLKQLYWKFDTRGNLTNTWCRLYTDAATDFNKLSPLEIATVSRFDNEVVCFGVSINVSKSPLIVETQVKGFGSPVFQQYATNSYDFTITFLTSGSVFWEQNSKQIKQLIEVLDSGKTINIFNPQLSIIYGIDKAVVTGYSIGQDPRFYSHNNISISFKSDDSRDILKPVSKD